MNLLLFILGFMAGGLFGLIAGALMGLAHEVEKASTALGPPWEGHPMVKGRLTPAENTAAAALELFHYWHPCHPGGEPGKRNRHESV